MRNMLARLFFNDNGTDDRWGGMVDSTETSPVSSSSTLPLYSFPAPFSFTPMLFLSPSPSSGPFSIQPKSIHTNMAQFLFWPLTIHTLSCPVLSLTHVMQLSWAPTPWQPTRATGELIQVEPYEHAMKTVLQALHLSWRSLLWRMHFWFPIFLGTQRNTKEWVDCAVLAYAAAWHADHLLKVMKMLHRQNNR